MLTTAKSLARAFLGKAPTYTEVNHDEWLINATAATTTAIGDILMVDSGTISATFEYTQVILPTTAGFTGVTRRVFCVAQNIAAVGELVRCRFLGDTVLTVTSGNATANVLLMPINAAVGAATATTGLVAIALSKEASTGTKRVFFNGFGITVA